MRDPVPMRFRRYDVGGGWFEADDAASFVRGEKLQWHHTPEELVGVEPAMPGDTWVSRWAKSDLQPDAIRHVVDGLGPIAGYAICCPKCLHVHAWCSAHGCGFNPQTYSYVDKDGKTVTGTVCGHSGISSCWTWTGSAEEGTLSASPSLHCVEALGGCGWHGYLTNGVLKHC